MEKIIVADASCLIALEKIGELDLLKQIYTEIYITPEVLQEFGLMLPPWMHVIQVRNKSRLEVLQLILDAGEASSIALCLESPDSLLIVDERKGRSIAQAMGLLTIGTLGVLIEAKRMNIISLVQPIIKRLKEVDFRMAPNLIEYILKITGEDAA